MWWTKDTQRVEPHSEVGFAHAWVRPSHQRFQQTHLYPGIIHSSNAGDLAHLKFVDSVRRYTPPSDLLFPFSLPDETSNTGATERETPPQALCTHCKQRKACVCAFEHTHSQKHLLLVTQRQLKAHVGDTLQKCLRKYASSAILREISGGTSY